MTSDLGKARQNSEFHMKVRAGTCLTLYVLGFLTQPQPLALILTHTLSQPRFKFSAQSFREIFYATHLYLLIF